MDTKALITFFLIGIFVVGCGSSNSKTESMIGPSEEEIMAIAKQIEHEYPDATITLTNVKKIYCNNIEQDTVSCKLHITNNYTGEQELDVFEYPTEPKTISQTEEVDVHFVKENGKWKTAHR